MEEKDRQLLLEFKNRLPVDLQRHMKKLIVFGSRVRGTHTDDSDLDIAVLVDQKTADIEKGFEDIAYSVMWDNDFRAILSLKVLETTKFEDALSRGYSFYRHIQTEGVAA